MSGMRRLRLTLALAGGLAGLAILTAGGARAQDPDAQAPGVVTRGSTLLPMTALPGAAERAGSRPLSAVPGPLLVPPGIPRPDPTPDPTPDQGLAPATSLRPVPRDTWAMPAAHWDGHPDGGGWTAAVMAALRGPGAPLLETVPRDIRHWCPGYPAATPAQRAAFWTGLVSALAWHESGHDPEAVGGDGQWFGLLQIAPGTARGHRCEAGASGALMQAAANLRCAIRIMAATVPRDGVVSEGMAGVAADWGPFHSGQKRAEMRDWVRAQPYCQLPPPGLRPVMRPERGGIGQLADAGRAGEAGARRVP